MDQHGFFRRLFENAVHVPVRTQEGSCESAAQATGPHLFMYGGCAHPNRART